LLNAGPATTASNNTFSFVGRDAELAEGSVRSRTGSPTLNSS
jgi:hypothetical protein